MDSHDTTGKLKDLAGDF